MILNFFDGFRDNFEVAAPILDRLGMIGWFFVVSGWVMMPPEQQRAFAARHLIDLPYREEDLPTNGRLALSTDELRDLAERGHIVASHTDARECLSWAYPQPFDIGPGTRGC